MMNDQTISKCKYCDGEPKLKTGMAEDFADFETDGKEIFVTQISCENCYSDNSEDTAFTAAAIVEKSIKLNKETMKNAIIEGWNSAHDDSLEISDEDDEGDEE